jgi:hypothetical protein
MVGVRPNGDILNVQGYKSSLGLELVPLSSSFYDLSLQMVLFVLGVNEFSLLFTRIPKISQRCFYLWMVMKLVLL